MTCTATINDQSVTFDLTTPFDLSIPVTVHNPVNAFFLPQASFEPFRAGDFVGSVEEGGPVRCDVVTLAPHGNGTHTECVGHVAGRGYSLLASLSQQLVTGRLVTVPISEAGCIELADLQQAWTMWGEQALILRTQPNAISKRSAMWSGSHPPYVHPAAMHLIVDRGVEHLLIDLPSVDPEEDAGALTAHRIFWNYPDAPRERATITELIYVPDHVLDGQYLVDLNAAAFDGDAAPSRPTIYPCRKS